MKKGRDPDVEALREALRTARLHALNHRWGGLNRLYELTREALEALERVERRLEPRQLELFKGE